MANRRDLRVNIDADPSGFNRGMKSAEASAKVFERELKKIEDARHSVGRQPWLINGRLTVADALSPGLTTGMVTVSFIGFAGVLGLLAVVDYVLIARAVRRGPVAVALGADDPAGDAGRAHALSH